MPAVISLKIEELDTQLVKKLKKEYANAAVEIRVQEQPGAAEMFRAADFWAAIERLNWSADGDDAQVVEPLVQFLERQPLANIYRFADILSERLWQLDTRAHAQVFLDDPESEGYLSVDDFLYARCAVVAKGKDFYEKVLRQPDSMPTDLTFEPLLSIAATAYERKTGRHFAPDTAFNYETYSNQNGWKK